LEKPQIDAVFKNIENKKKEGANRENILVIRLKK
jgi:hypothetical protein